MEIEFKRNKIVFNRVLTNLDKLVLKFIRILDKQKIRYVIISGYVAILFGRSRHTEDVDLFIEPLDAKRFESFWKAVYDEGFECMNADSPKDALDDYLLEKLAIRFAEKGMIEPNFELKFPKSKYNLYSLDHPVEVFLSGERLVTSQLELQVAFKLSLGSDKDFEDARHLFKVFKPHLDLTLLKSHVRELGVEKQAEKVLWRNDLS